MSSIVNKIKEAVHSDKHSSHAEGTSGPHNSRVANAADPRIDSDRDGSHTVGGTTGGIGGTTGGLTGTHGAHGTHAGLTGTHNTTAGPHSSNLANKADPRVDSDRDGSNRIGGATGGLTGTGTHGGLTGSHNTTAGPHSSNLANKVDPRVDSDRDGSRTVGGTTGGYGGTTGGLTGTHRTHGGLTGSHNTTSGPHSSNLANQVDPRVDSDRDGSRTVGGTTGGFGGTTGGLTGTHGAHGTHGGGLTGTLNTTAGPHSSNIANKVDPRVDSDRDGSHTVGGATGGFGGTTSGIGGPTGGLTGSHGAHGTHGGLTGSTFGSGPAPHTAGPHKSDALNKIDPRVDSDRDGSSTLGGNQTYRSTGVDPTDAAQVPPSVLRQHIGEPTIDHDDHGHHRERRNSTATHQESFRGI